MRAFTLSRACTATRDERRETRDAASLEASAPLRLEHTEESWGGLAGAPGSTGTWP